MDRENETKGMFSSGDGQWWLCGGSALQLPAFVAFSENGAWGLGQITARLLTEPGKSCAVTSSGTV